jgi:hypothetical protein
VSSSFQPRPRLVRREPISAELAERLPLVLTDRDVSILAAVYTHGFLTTDLVELAYFPAQGSTRRHASACAYERLRQLWLWGFVERVAVPTTPGLGGRNPYLLALGPRAIPLVAQRLALSPAAVRRRRIDRLHPFAVAHDLQLARLWANLRAALDRPPGGALRWTAERELRARKDRVRDPHTGRWLPFLPDAYVELDRPGASTVCLVVEADLGTLTLDRFARKVRAFELFLEGGHFARRYGRAGFAVLVLGPGEVRLAHLRRVAEGVVAAPRRSAYLFGPLDQLDPRRFPDVRWRTLGGTPTTLPATGADPITPDERTRVTTESNDPQGDALGF